MVSLSQRIYIELENIDEILTELPSHIGTESRSTKNKTP